MALEATFRELSFSLRKLKDALIILQSAVGDKPPEGEAAVADDLEGGVLDVLGTLHEARKASALALKAAGYPVELDQARRSLAACQECCHRIEHQFSADLASYEKLLELTRLGSERGMEWLPWANNLKQAIEECRSPLQAVSLAVSRCWQELAERLGTTNISMQVKSVGQEISVPASVAADVEAEGVT
jgi:hypothetical protein